MADPLSICAVIALALAGRSLSQKQYEPKPTPPPPAVQRPQSADSKIEKLGDRNISKDVTFTFADIVPNANKDPNGEQANNLFRSRPYISSKMNNLGPVAAEQVGPGLGVGPNVPAYGGYQQLYQVRPTNVGAYKLTTLPGRSGPAMDITGGRNGLIGEMTHEPTAKTAFLPSRRPNIGGRAQGQGGALTGVVVRSEYEKTKLTTNRAETTTRTDGLNFAPAKRLVSTQTLEDNPTRNKGDVTTGGFYHVNNPNPGIHSFAGGYENTAISQMMADGNGKYTPEQLQKYGLRPEDKRGLSATNRQANGGRMNVRESPLNQSGQLTAVRMDRSRTDGRMSGVGGGWTQNYVGAKYHQFNSFKGNVDSRTSCNGLNIAKTQLANNPFNHPLS